MTDNRMQIGNEELEKVVGGMFDWDSNTMILTYTHANGSVTTHKIKDAKKAWQMSNTLHGQMVPEDDILAQMIDAGYIEG